MRSDISLKVCLSIQLKGLGIEHRARGRFRIVDVGCGIHFLARIDTRLQQIVITVRQNITRRLLEREMAPSGKGTF
jgi:hypothetical protein